MELFTQWHTYVAIASISLLLISLNIDNVVFMSIMLMELPEKKQKRAFRYAMLSSVTMPLIMLAIIEYLIRMKKPLLTIFNFHLSGKDLTMLFGGLFLLIKGVMELHDKLEGEEPHKTIAGHKPLWQVLLELMLLDLVFSLDSVITAAGMSDKFIVSAIAVVFSIVVVYSFARPISNFVQRHPTFKVLALSFLILIGVLLVSEAFHHPIPKGYIYFAMAFSLFVETINTRIRRRQRPPVALRMPKVPERGYPGE